MRIWVEQSAFDEIALLLGHIRQRVRRLIKDLQENARPSQSRTLTIPDDMRQEGLEARRIRLDNWRIVYVIEESWDMITVLAIRKRPPYTYDDLQELLNKL